MRRVCGFKQSGQRSGLQGCGKFGLGHRGVSGVSGAVYFKSLAQNRFLIIALKCGAKIDRSGTRSESDFRKENRENR
jgi:hypothetical protein